MEVYLTPKPEHEIAERQSQTAGRLRARFPDAVLEQTEFRGEMNLIVKSESIFEIARFLRDTPELLYRHLADLTAVDYLRLGTERGRFAVVYLFYSFKYGGRIRLKCFLWFSVKCYRLAFFVKNIVAHYLMLILFLNVLHKNKACSIIQSILHNLFHFVAILFHAIYIMFY